MKKIFLGLLLIVVASCSKQERNDIKPQSWLRTSNDSVDVALLFEKDGYRIYRFADAGYYRYFVVPGGTTLSSIAVPHFNAATKMTKYSIKTEEIQTVK